MRTLCRLLSRSLIQYGPSAGLGRRAPERVAAVPRDRPKRSDRRSAQSPEPKRTDEARESARAAYGAEVLALVVEAVSLRKPEIYPTWYEPWLLFDLVQAQGWSSSSA